MADGRKRLGGWEYRKLREQKELKETEVLEKTKKISDYFVLSNIKSSASASTASTDNADVPVPSTSTNVNESFTKFEMQCDVQKSVEEITQEDASKVTDKAILAPESETLILKDPFWWVINDNLRDYFAVNGFEQNILSDFSKSKKEYNKAVRYCTKAMFQRVLVNGQKINRRWLIYSEEKASVYCGVCRLFSNDAEATSTFVNTGFNDWRNSTQRLSEHENSLCHKKNAILLTDRGNKLNRIDKSLLEQLENESQYWKKVLYRVVVVVKALASRGLPFRGKTEKFGSVHNGNYMMLLEVFKT